ncbi:TPA: HD-GYP domain-containing protein [Legionella pneumophila subsp. pneumophila]|nr:HD-GYP domain-containing protein [Legionella pneumophila]HAT9675390.1 HD domain-containing protein [Legionella pneumophila subsp. pneumophila]HAT6820160.1 HD domain-containing protein [Legionella pneumophila]HBD7114963.1 HD-GYP domain-containing protein [Legionella pneumophila]HBD7212035.1 HD-GYP domain-containing protein [Legionella pneumophila]
MKTLTSNEKILLRLIASKMAFYTISSHNERQGFLTKLVSSIPGVDSCYICLMDPKNPIPCVIESEFFDPLVCDETCSSLEEFNRISKNISKDISIYPIVTSDSFYGIIAIKLGDPSRFRYFDPVINNFAISISTILENQFQKNKLEKINQELETHKKNLQGLVTKKTASLEKAKKKLEQTIDRIIHALAATIEIRDPYTSGHQYRVAILSQAIAKKFGLSSKKIHEIFWGALIHDIGKIQIPLEILTSPIKLNELQMRYIKSHPEAGWNIIQSIGLSPIIIDIVLHHHERIDGSGYPDRLKGEELPLTTKIVSVADVFEAMTSHRPYRPKLALESALQSLEQGAGRIYDQSVVDCCIALIKEEDFKLPKLPSSLLFN